MRSYIALIGAVLCAPSIASASVITYSVTVNTSSLWGMTGSLDFQFNPGPLATQSASLQVLNFSSNGSLMSCVGNVQGFCPTGDVSGQLPGTLTFDNLSGFNDYFDGFTFVNTLSFNVSLYGPALSAPNGWSTSGSTFAFSMFSDNAGTISALTSDAVNGFAVNIDVNLDGSTTVNNFSSQTTVAPVTSGSTPEPGTLTLIVVALLSGGLLRSGQSAISQSNRR